MPRRRLLGASLVAALVTVSACTTGPEDRTGSDVLQLRMATIDGYDFGTTGGSQSGPETFVRELESLSGGRIDVAVTTGYGDGSAEAESRLVTAIARGDLDGGFPATRAFAAAGIHGLEAVEAPFELVDRDAVRELVTGEAAGVTLDLLDGSGVVGVGLADGGLRRPFATRALNWLDGWRDTRFRVSNSPVEADTVAALGGVPVPAGAAWVEQASAGRLDGADLGLEQYLGNGYTDEADELSVDVVLWPKVWVLALSRDRYDDLSDEQREWVAVAAARATAASLRAPDDQAYVAGLCDRGVHFHRSTREQQQGLREAVRPVLEELRDDPATAELMRVVEGIAQRHPDPEVPRVPDDCGSGSPPAVDDVPASTSAFPDGVYRTEVPAEAVAAAGISNGPGYSGTWTLTVEQGTYALTCRPLELPGKDCGGTVTSRPLEAGRLRGTDDRAYFVSDLDLLASLSGCSQDPQAGAEEQCAAVETYAARWRVDRDRLVLDQLAGPAGSYLVLRPWTRIASTG